jgi:2-desacetyl-2-hydroxyethyl bacteriochlorophyllide A dehydrogenase
VEAVGICGTDLSLYAWHQEIVDLYHPPLPLIMGHEFSGRVVSVGPEVAGFAAGELVAVNPIKQCGHCLYCQTGKTNLCDHRLMLGTQEPGAFAEYVVVPATHAIALPDKVGGDVAALCEPFCVALHALERVPVHGKTVAVAGAGPIGLLVLVAALANGAERCLVTGLSRDARRLELAATLGAHPVNVSDQDPVDVVKEVTAGQGADVVFETAGHPTAVSQAIALARKGGRVGLLGLPHAPTAIATNAIAAREQELIGVRAYTPRTWQTCKALVPAIAPQLALLVSHRFALEDFDKAFGVAISKEAIKVVLCPAPRVASEGHSGTDLAGGQQEVQGDDHIYSLHASAQDGLAGDHLCIRGPRRDARRWRNGRRKEQRRE